MFEVKVYLENLKDIQFKKFRFHHEEYISEKKNFEIE